MGHITDATLDRLSDELKGMARDLDGQQHFNDDLRKSARDLAVDMMDLALDRSRLTLFADLLSRPADRDTALAELTDTRTAA